MQVGDSVRRFLSCERRFRGGW